MFRKKLGGICVVVTIVSSSGMASSQEAANPTAATAVSPATETRIDGEIPISVLRQILHLGSEVKADLPKEQIEAMRRVQGQHYEKCRDLDQLTTLLSTSTFRNRRFDMALAALRAERDGELHKAWLSLLSPEQKASIRRRNRLVIMRSVSVQNQATQSLLYDDRSLDVLMTNNDLMSVVERPAIQDLLELDDEQFEKTEQLRKAAEVDAVDALRQTMDFISKTGNAQAQAPKPSPTYEKLIAETMMILSADQATEYKKLMSDPSQLHKMLQTAGEKDPQAIFKVMMPHGLPTRMATRVSGGNATVDAEFHNAFSSPFIQSTLKLTEDQQKKIADLLEESRAEMLAELQVNTEAYQKERTRKNDELASLLKSHNERFHAQAAAILTTAQLQRIEKERLRELRLWALKKPNVRTALELTAEQAKAIDEILAQPPKQLEIPTPTVGGDFQKESEEFFRRSKENSDLIQEHFQKQNTAVEQLLTEQQKATFTEMTGHQFTQQRSN